MDRMGTDGYEWGWGSLFRYERWSTEEEEKKQ
jgi:hypothetical protein